MADRTSYASACNLGVDQIPHNQDLRPRDPDSGAARHVKAISAYLDAGFDRVYINQIGPDQREFFDFFARETPSSVGINVIRLQRFTKGHLS